MNDSSQSVQPIRAGPIWIYFSIIGLTLLLAVSHESYWIDEANTAVVAMQTSLHDWWQSIMQLKSTELQAPLYSLYIWAYAQVCGASEWPLRAAGLLWLVPGLTALATGFPRPDQRGAALVVAATSPFIWYYAGEARPYAMYIGTSCLVLGAICRLSQDALTTRKQSLWLSGVLFGFVCLCGASMLGVVWAGCALLVAFFVIPQQRLLQLWKIGCVRVVLTLLLLAGLGAYFLWTLRIGARGTTVSTTDWRSIGFVLYEQLGLLGLGPSRTDLREGGMRLLRPYAPILLPASVLIGAVLINGFRQMAKGQPAGRAAGVVLAVAGSALFLFGAGAVLRWRVLGRHSAGLMPVWITLLAFGLAGFWRRPGLLGKTVAAAYLAMALWSCLSIRFAPRHARDDYRDAAQCARLALEQNQVVWWNAAENGARYYKVPLATVAPEKSKALWLINPTAESLAMLEKPNVVIVSKADLFDSSGTMAEYLTRGHYRPSEQFPAFTVWRD
jgi:hypothetical protein